MADRKKSENLTEIEKLDACLREASELVSRLAKPGIDGADTSGSNSGGQSLQTVPQARPYRTARHNMFSSGRANVERAVSNLQHVTSRARAMIHQASSTGTMRRLGQSERLRSIEASTSPRPRVSFSPTNARNDPANKQPKVDESRPFEFSLMRFSEDDMDRSIKDEHIALRGFVTLFQSDKEKDIRQKLAKAIQIAFPIVNGKDLVFLKANRRKLTKVVNNDSFDYKQIKLLAGQGAIYMMLKDGHDFMFVNSFDDDEENDDGVDSPEPVNSSDLSTNKQNSDNEDRNIADNSETNVYSSHISETVDPQKSQSDAVEKKEKDKNDLKEDI